MVETTIRFSSFYLFSRPVLVVGPCLNKPGQIRAFFSDILTLLVVIPAHEDVPAKCLEVYG